MKGGWHKVHSVLRLTGDVLLLCFFFQAEDGIRDVAVTGVQTCALPIYLRSTDSRVGAVPPLRRPAARSWRFRCTQASWLSAWARSFCTVAHWRSNKFWL